MAVQRYIVALSAAWDAALKIPADAGMCFNMIIQAQGRKKGLTQLLGLVWPLIDPLLRFKGAIDIIAQTHGGVATSTWGPLRMVITVAIDHLKTLESLAVRPYRVVGSLERFNPAAQKAVGALSSHLIEVCIRIVQYHSRSSFRAIITSFDKDFPDVPEHINFHFYCADKD